MKSKTKPIRVGGQAVIEGVMMRSPERIAVAVRRAGGRIALRRYEFVSLGKKFRIFSWPVLRGAVMLVESMWWGVKALNFSGDVAMMDEAKTDTVKPDKRSAWSAAATILFALGIGLVVFFYLPLLLTEWIGVKGSFAFNLVDGGIRLVFFLIYLGLISLWKEVRRVFEYHGAEHKAVFAFEAGAELTTERVKPFSTHHPRCGTSFLLIVMVVSILVFACLGRPTTIGERLIRFLFVPVIAGLSYEIIRLSESGRNTVFGRLISAPGLWLQKITTQEPDDSQIEVAITALNAALGRPVGDVQEMAEA
jgi:uncharacterized protein YqhQ